MSLVSDFLTQRRSGFIGEPFTWKLRNADQHIDDMLWLAERWWVRRLFNGVAFKVWQGDRLNGQQVTVETKVMLRATTYSYVIDIKSREYCDQNVVIEMLEKRLGPYQGRQELGKERYAASSDPVTFFNISRLWWWREKRPWFGSALFRPGP